MGGGGVGRRVGIYTTLYYGQGCLVRRPVLVVCVCGPDKDTEELCRGLALWAHDDGYNSAVGGKMKSRGSRQAKPKPRKFWGAVENLFWMEWNNAVRASERDGAVVAALRTLMFVT